MPGREDVHHLAGRQERRDGVEAARERLADGDRVGPDALVLEGEQLPGAAQARLDLVQHQQDAVRVAQLAQPLQEARRAGSITPPSPWIGSTSIAQVWGVIAAAHRLEVAVGQRSRSPA